MQMTRLTGGEAVVQSLVQNGLNTIYGLPGVQSINSIESVLYK